MGSRLPRILLLAAAALTACQVPSITNRPATPTASPAPSQSADLVSADRKLFGGDYDGAETAYLDLIKSSTPGAASHYALLLAYEGRFQEAVAQAEKGVADRRDSSSLARLCRTLDWAENLPAAVARCAESIAAQPVDPVAHAFYGEALTDSGRYDEATKELRAAERAAKDAYSKAEAAREWANYYRQRTNSSEEFNYLQIAQKAQPAFPERTLELARHQYLAKKPEAARELIRQVRNARGVSYRVLVAAGDSAWIGQDVDTATALYQAAIVLQPDAAPAVLGLAEVEVAARRDFKAAHDRLLAALRKDPAQSAVYQYLRYLDLLVLKTDPAELNPISPQPPGQLADSRRRALERINGQRAAAGVPSIKEDSAMAEAAQAHAHYFLFNFGQPQISGLGVHAEDPTLPGFVAQNGLLRARHWGYTGTRGSEVINHVYTPESAVQVWVDSVFHRFPIIDRETSVTGYGEARIGLLSIAVVDFGLAPAAKGDPVMFPPDQARDVPTSFTGNELPDPLPEGAQPPAGYPITLEAGGASVLTGLSGRLIGPDGKEVTGFALSPGRELGQNEWAFLASSPLKAGALYTVEVSGQIDGQPFTKRWSFTVVQAA